MTSFEEQFPSINLCSNKHQEGNYEICKICGTNHMVTLGYTKVLISNNCLDKQKVRDAINKFDFTADTELEREALKFKLEKELGL